MLLFADDVDCLGRSGLCQMAACWVQGHNKGGLAGWRGWNKLQGVRQSNEVLTQKAQRVELENGKFLCEFGRDGIMDASGGLGKVEDEGGKMAGGAGPILAGLPSNRNAAKLEANLIGSGE